MVARRGNIPPPATLFRFGTTAKLDNFVRKENVGGLCLLLVDELYEKFTSNKYSDNST